MPELGRWGVIDPHARNYEIVTPYNYAFNNPMLFVDPNGKDNIIYIVVAGNFSRGKAQAVANKANEMIGILAKNLGVALATKFVLYDAKKSGELNEAKLDKTDSWLVIGTDRNAIAQKAKSISKDESYHKALDAWTKDDPSLRGMKPSSPEVSNNNPYGKGIAIDYDDAIGGRDESEQSALWSIHGAGHSAPEVIEEGGHLDQGVMQRGASTFSPGLAQDYYDHGLKTVLAPNPLPGQQTGNDVYMKGMMQRYQTKQKSKK
jgi:hypothetical protein